MRMRYDDSEFFVDGRSHEYKSIHKVLVSKLSALDKKRVSFLTCCCVLGFCVFCTADTLAEVQRLEPWNIIAGAMIWARTGEYDFWFELYKELNPFK